VALEIAASSLAVSHINFFFVRAARRDKQISHISEGLQLGGVAARKHGLLPSVAHMEVLFPSGLHTQASPFPGPQARRGWLRPASPHRP